MLTFSKRTRELNWRLRFWVEIIGLCIYIWAKGIQAVDTR
jgi:hypothetical protein